YCAHLRLPMELELHAATTVELTPLAAVDTACLENLRHNINQACQHILQLHVLCTNVTPNEGNAIKQCVYELQICCRSIVRLLRLSPATYVSDTIATTHDHPI